jgi:hypothetical protein
LGAFDDDLAQLLHLLDFVVEEDDGQFLLHLQLYPLLLGDDEGVVWEFTGEFGFGDGGEVA